MAIEDRGTWTHPGTPMSSKFICTLCGGEAFYPQPTGRKYDGRRVLRIPYQFCPCCGKRMLPIIAAEEKDNG